MHDQLRGSSDWLGLKQQREISGILVITLLVSTVWVSLTVVSTVHPLGSWFL